MKYEDYQLKITMKMHRKKNDFKIWYLEMFIIRFRIYFFVSGKKKVISFFFDLKFNPVISFIFRKCFLWHSFYFLIQPQIYENYLAENFLLEFFFPNFISLFIRFYFVYRIPITVQIIKRLVCCFGEEEVENKFWNS